MSRLLWHRAEGASMLNRSNVQNVSKIWGREVILVDGDYCAKFLQYDGVRTSSLHYHKEKHETFVVVKGTFEIEWYHVDLPQSSTKEIFGPGKALVLAPYTVHRVKCVSPEGGSIFEASTGEDPDDCVRLEPSVNPFGQG
jgi:mannose-6-phosphate isomerase-like protein (cupin superfamily)